MVRLTYEEAHEVLEIQVGASEDQVKKGKMMFIKVLQEGEVASGNGCDLSSLCVISSVHALSSSCHTQPTNGKLLPAILIETLMILRRKKDSKGSVLRTSESQNQRRRRRMVMSKASMKMIS